MDLLPLSQFKLQLLSLITEVRHLRQREQSARENLDRSIQKQKQMELEFSRKFQELQMDLASSEELRQKLESKVKYLQNDNAMLEKKQKELKETIDSLLQSREAFVSHYEDSTCEMKHSIEIRDKKLAVLSEKLRSNLLLFNSIEKEAVAVKQVVDDVRCLVSEREQVVANLKKKMDKISTFEQGFVEKISSLENNLRNNLDEILRKDAVVLELKEHLEAAKTSSNLQLQIEEISIPMLMATYKALVIKEEAILNLTSEKQGLQFEVKSLELVLQRMQETITSINAEEGQEPPTMIRKEEDNRVEDTIHIDNEVSQHKDLGQGAGERTALPLYQEKSLVDNHSPEKHLFDLGISEHFVYSPPPSACSDPQSTANILNISVDGKKDNCTLLVHQLDSDSSTTNAEASEDGKSGKT